MNASIEIVKFNTADIITTSDECLDPSGEYFPLS